MNMASDGWHNDDILPSSNKSVKKSSGVDPSLFYKKKLHNNKKQQSAAEKQLNNILNSAARNEIVQKRHEYTSTQKIERDAYHKVTCLEVYPLQDLAMDKYNQMMNDYNLSSIDTTTKDGDGMGNTYEVTDCKRRKFVDRDNDQKLLWSMQPRIFALETSTTGKRKYIVGNLGRFLEYYWRDSMSKHFYELIPESTPCRLYFDLEYSVEANPQITLDDRESLVEEFIAEICTEFKMVHDISITRSCIVDLDSSTSTKFSRHLIVHLPNGELFADTFAVGQFVKRFVIRLSTDEALKKRHTTLTKYLFVNKKAQKTNEVTQEKDSMNEQHEDLSRNKNMTCFVDLGVYTRNRLFRILGSTKYGKPPDAALRIADVNQFPFPNGFDNSKFYQASTSKKKNSVESSDSYESRQKEHDDFCASLDWEDHAKSLALTLVVPAVDAGRILMEQSRGSSSSQNISSDSVITRKQHKTMSRSYRGGESPLPKLDCFILQISKRGGTDGKIRSWSMEGSHSMSYQMSNNRYCENIGRAHRSNNIIWNVDFKAKTYWQTCHDPECQSANFRGRLMQLPDEVTLSIEEYLLDQELACIDEDKLIQEVSTKFGDKDFDEALCDVDMSQFQSRLDHNL